MPEATVTGKGQVTIPKSVRDLLNLRPGDRIRFLVEADGTVRLESLARTVDEVFGFLSSPERQAVAVEEMKIRLRRAVRQRNP